MSVTAATHSPTISKAPCTNHNANLAKLTPVSSAGITIEDVSSGNGPVRRSLITLTAFVLAITDALAYSGTQLWTYPQGIIWNIGAVADLTFTTTSAIATTLNSGVTVQYGLGSVTASATTLATTMIDIAPGSGQTVPTFTSSTVISTAATAVQTGNLAVASKLDGTSTAAKCFLNLALATATDIDGDATLSVTGTILHTWMNLGDY